MKELTKKITESFKHSVVFKMLVIGILILVLLIPLTMIEGVIREREDTRIYAENDIIGTWGGEPTVGGPFLTVPYIMRTKDDEGHVQEYRQLARFLPDLLEIRGSVLPETRSRGIYEVTVYNAELAISGSFKRPDFSEWRISDGDILWDNLFGYC